MTVNENDFLSLSPSLLDILHFVDYKDIPNCQLVNRRIDDTIQKKLLSLPRQTVKFILRCDQKKDIPFILIIISTICESNESLILAYFAEGYTFLLKGNEVDAHYSTHGVPPAVSAHEENGAIEMLRARISQHHSHDYRIYGNNGVASELKLLLSLIAPRYHFKYIHTVDMFSPLLSESVLHLMTNVFRENRSKCDTFYASKVAPGLEKLINVLEMAIWSTFFEQIAHRRRKISSRGL